MAKPSAVFCLLLAVLLFTSQGGDKMAAEAQQCIVQWNCNKAKDACNTKCMSTYKGVGTCENPSPNLCSCRYDC